MTNFVIYFVHFGWVSISGTNSWFTQTVLQNPGFAEDAQDATHIAVFSWLFICFLF